MPRMGIILLVLFCPAMSWAAGPCQLPGCTDTVAVDVATEYRPDASDPDRGRYVWDYRATIYNRSDVTLHIQEQEWLFEDQDGRLYDHRESGIDGMRPAILAGQGYWHDGRVTLHTPNGSLEGWYWVSTPDGERFQVIIPYTELALPE